MKFKTVLDAVLASANEKRATWMLVEEPAIEFDSLLENAQITKLSRTHGPNMWDIQVVGEHDGRPFKLSLFFDVKKLKAKVAAERASQPRYEHCQFSGNPIGYANLMEKIREREQEGYELISVVFCGERDRESGYPIMEAFMKRSLGLTVTRQELTQDGSRF